MVSRRDQTYSGQAREKSKDYMVVEIDKPWLICHISMHEKSSYMKKDKKAKKILLDQLELYLFDLLL